MHSLRLVIAGMLAAGLLTAMPALAQETPSAWVGRVSAVAGGLSYRAAGAWTKAVANDPVGAGMGFRTDADTNAELRIGANRLALSSSSELNIARLDRGTMQVAVLHGRVDLDLAASGAGDRVEIDIPRGSIWLLQSGHYDIDAGTEDEPARIAAFDGSARFVGAHADLAIAAGQVATLHVSDSISASFDRAVPDGFVEWCQTQGVEVPAAAAAEMTGYDALDGHGRWETITGYGTVWFPSALAADWTPYRNGSWSWIEPWGWTWIADEPWGFAPAHYGRWALIDSRWGWLPGNLDASAVYAPAVVAFLGTAGVGLSVADTIGPAVAWFPLAPGEVYWPGYSRDIGYIRALNAGDVEDSGTIRVGVDGEAPGAIVNGNFANRDDASAVPRSVFVAGRPVAASLLDVPKRRLRVAPLITGALQIPPGAPRPPVVVAMPAPEAHVAAAIAPHPPAPHLPAGASQRPAAKQSPPALRVVSAHSSSVHSSGPHSPGAHLHAPAFAQPTRPRHAMETHVAEVRMPTARAHHLVVPASFRLPHGRSRLASGRDTRQ